MTANSIRRNDNDTPGQRVSSACVSRVLSGEELVSKEPAQLLGWAFPIQEHLLTPTDILIFFFFNLQVAFGENLEFNSISACMLNHFSCDPLFATPWTVAHQAPLSMGFSRILEWVAMSSSRGSSWPRDWTQGSNPVSLSLQHWQAGSLPLEASAKPRKSVQLTSIQFVTVSRYRMPVFYCQSISSQTHLRISSLQTRHLGSLSQT